MDYKKVLEKVINELKERIKELLWLCENCPPCDKEMYRAKLDEVRLTLATIMCETWGE